MKKLLIAFTLTIAAFTGSVFAAEASDAKAQQYAAEIQELQKELAIKESEYSEYIKSLDLRNAESEVKMRGNASRCSYQCSLRHKNDMYMWNSCFRACTN
ncbi:MAG: hypothetical protein ACRBBW_14030 [Cellvibrionaceae bacterium]